MLTLHTSNRLEQLSQQFSESIKPPLQDALTAEIVVVQNAGMARYLSLQLADKQGISANMSFLFPAEFMWQTLKTALPNISEQDPSAPTVTRWRLLALLLEEITSDKKSFPELSHYLNNTESAWDLSLVLTEMLDKILFYRDDWVRDWEKPENVTSQTSEKWQARLWQKLFKDKGIDHWLSLQDQFVQTLKQANSKDYLPQRVSFFSLSALSPGYIRLLGEMGKVMEINLFIINPCPESFWGDIESEKSISKKPSEEQTYFDSGNALLASMGRQGRDFIDQLQNLDECHFEESNYEQNPSSLLTQIQQDIFNLAPAQHTTNFNKSDSSIQFHACHTAMREVEVLHDQLLDCLQNDPELAPSDIIVMTPDIEKYAPYIDAVFSAKQDNSPLKNIPKLPFSIADQNPAHAQPTVEAFLKVLDLMDKRFDAESVFELLDYVSIQDKFDLKVDEVLFCREIARATNIRWGISAETRKHNKLPNTDEHTWRYAFDRLLLGYALAGDDLFIADNSMPLNGLPILPFSDIEGNQAQVISRLIQFTDALFKLEKFNETERSLDDWLDTFNQFIRSLFADESQNRLLFNALDNLRQQAKLADFIKTDDSQESITLPFSIVCKIIKQSLNEISGAENFMGYGITFCALVPMRSVPFKVVALLGMNDGEYPRQDRSMSFDLVAQAPRKGDRSRRNEDRYLFLESLLAAREKLIISYIGQSVKDNTAVPPSTLVSELLDEVCIYTNSKNQDWVCNHPLQAFSENYFNGNDARLFSYKNAYTKIKKSKQAPSQIFIKQPLEALADQKKQLNLNELIRFYQNPARTFLKERFNISNFDKDLVLPIREPFELEAFKNRDIRQQVLDSNCAEDSLKDSAQVTQYKDALTSLRAKGLLPYGDIGSKLFESEENTIQQFIKKLPEFDELSKQDFQLTFDEGFSLRGELNNVSDSGRLIQQVSQPFAGDYISLWINHLVLNTQNLNDAQLQTHFYSPEIRFKLLKVDNSHSILQKLIQYYWQGLHFPLHFYAKPAFKQYADKQENGGIGKAESAWTSDHFGTSEAQKFENWLLYRAYSQDELFDDEYEAISELMMGDLFLHYEES
jgi:exodeoxyribonuclease V gamma subunit